MSTKEQYCGTRLDNCSWGGWGKPIRHVNPLLKEFRLPLPRGNVVDLAVGVIIGFAFGKIVDALVTNVVMPPLSILRATLTCRTGW